MSDENNKPQTALAKAAPLPVVDTGEFDMLMDSARFAQLQRVGSMYAHSKMVPAHFQGDEPSCMVAVQMAMRLHVDPFMFLQKTYVVGGKPGMEATLAIALINTRGPFDGPIDWNFERDAAGEVVECTAFATHKKTGKVYSAAVTWKMVNDEGWNKKQGSKWLTLREQMFTYRSAVFLGRRVCPEVLMGMSTLDELHDLAEIDVTPAAERPTRRTLHERLGIELPIEEVRQAPQEPAGATPAPAPTSEVQPAARSSSTPSGEPPIPSKDVIAMLKKAKTRDQGEILLDTLNDVGYSDTERAEGKRLFEEKFATQASPS